MESNTFSRFSSRLRVLLGVVVKYFKMCSFNAFPVFTPKKYQAKIWGQRLVWWQHKAVNTKCAELLEDLSFTIGLGALSHR